MKTRDKQKLHQQSLKELVSMLEESQKELMSLRLQKKAGKLKNVRLPFKKRKEIALIKTIIRKKELSAN